MVPQLLRAAVLAAAAAALVCVVVVSSSTGGATELASRDGGLLGLVTGQAPRGGAGFMTPNRLQQLASMMKQSDFPFALESGKPASAQAAAAIARETPEAYADVAGDGDAVDVAAGEPQFQPGPALAAAQPQGKPTLKVAKKAQKLTANEADGGLSPIEEPKAEDNPIGLAEAAKILKDEDVYDQAKESGALPNWKAAVAGSGKSILNEVTDDVTSFNPFPHKSLSEQMEVKAVWDKARAAAKPAGSLDQDAKTTKSSIENAEAQADSAAYLAANEAAAVDSYDLSFPNPDTMAVGKGKTMATQALANGVRKGNMHQALAHTPRVQALAEVRMARGGGRSERRAPTRAPSRSSSRLRWGWRWRQRGWRTNSPEAARTLTPRRSAPRAT